jgi:hypothetical protein
MVVRAHELRIPQLFRHGRREWFIFSTSSINDSLILIAAHTVLLVRPKINESLIFGNRVHALLVGHMN